jgi:hypothetical protein
MSADAKRPIDREAIRAMVRQVLRDALPETVREQIASQAAKPAAAPTTSDSAATGAAQPPRPRIEEVALTTDAELAAFLRRVLILAGDERQREALQSGRLKFRLKRARKSADAAAATQGGTEHIDKGIVTEKRIMAAARAGKTLVVGRGVAVTPLARDKARQLGVKIERE